MVWGALGPPLALLWISGSGFRSSTERDYGADPAPGPSRGGPDPEDLPEESEEHSKDKPLSTIAPGKGATIA
jgi:hypothetical protein